MREEVGDSDILYLYRGGYRESLWIGLVCGLEEKLDHSLSWGAGGSSKEGIMVLWERTVVVADG